MSSYKAKGLNKLVWKCPTLVFSVINAEHCTVGEMSNSSDKLCNDSDISTQPLQKTQDHMRTNKHKRTTNFPRQGLMIFYGVLEKTIYCRLTLILLTWKIRWAPNHASRWQMGFDLVFKGLNQRLSIKNILATEQYWYRKDRSTQAPCALINGILEAWNSKSQAAGIFVTSLRLSSV